MLDTKIKKYFCLILIFVAINFIFAALFLIAPAQAQDQEPAFEMPETSITLPGMADFEPPFRQPCKDSSQQTTAECWNIPWIAQYLGAAYKYGAALAAVIAVVMLAIGGILYIVGGANQTLISKAKEYIIYSIFGLVLIMGSYILLNTINPQLLNLTTIEIEAIKRAEMEDISDVFCKDLDDEVYSIPDFVKDTSPCGQKFNFTVKKEKPGVKLRTYRTDCFAHHCEGDQNCIKNPEGKYVCKKVLFWGEISDTSERYMENVWLVSVEHDGIGSRISDEIDVGEGQKTFYIPYHDEWVEEMNQAGQVALEIELNNTEKQTAKITAEDLGLGVVGEMFINLVRPNLDDDEYYVGRSNDNRFIKGENHYQGIWFNMCDAGAVTMWPCTAARGGTCGTLSLGQDKWLYGAGVSIFSAGEVIKSGGIRVDIDANYFREDSKAKCDMAEKLLGDSFQTKGAACKKSELGKKSANGTLKCVLAGDDIYS
jgi:hypothetical protein